MAYEALVKGYFQGVADFWLDLADRWQAARDLAEKTPPAYTADLFASDAVVVWGKAMDAWWGPFSAGSPVLPTVAITARAPNIPTQHPSGSAYLASAPPKTAMFSSTDLLRLGAAGSIVSAQVALAVTRWTLTVTLNVPAGPNPAVGLYQGLAYANGALNIPLAVILLNVPP